MSGESSNEVDEILRWSPDQQTIQSHKQDGEPTSQLPSITTTTTTKTTTITTSNSNNTKSSSTNASVAVNNNTTTTSEDDYMDDYTDDDDDDSKSNLSSSNQNLNPNSVSFNGSKQTNKVKGQLHKDEDKRAHHNVLERRRRDHLKDSFSQLRESMPSFRNERASRTEILVQAADFIISRVQKNTLMQQELDALIKENKKLEEAQKLAMPTPCVPGHMDIAMKTENASS